MRDWTYPSIMPPKVIDLFVWLFDEKDGMVFWMDGIEWYSGDDDD